MKNKIQYKGHIGMLSHSYYPGDIRVRREAEALAEAGFRVEVVCLRMPKISGRFPQAYYERINNVNVYRLPISRKRGSAVRYLTQYLASIVLGAWKLTVLQLISSFQAVHIHNMPDALILAGLIPKCMGAKLILDVHDPMPELYASTNDSFRKPAVLRVLKWQEKWSRQLADCIFTVNESMRENMQEKRIRPDRISVVHNFPDLRYLPLKDDIASWTPNKDRMVWLYAGTINRQYRLDVAIRALKIASPYLPLIKLRLLGEGNDLEQLRQLAESLGVRRNIEFLDPVYLDRLKNFMDDADIGISCNQAGPFGDLQFSTKIIDYLSQGLPVVTSRTKTLTRYIPEDTVFYFEPGNAEDMAEKVIFLWDHPDIVERKMENAKKLFPQYTWQEEKTKLIQFYRGICANFHLASG